MDADRKRFIEVRLIVIIVVDLTAPALTEALVASGGQPSSVAKVVASEVVSNLESVAYVDTVIASPL